MSLKETEFQNSIDEGFTSELFLDKDCLDRLKSLYEKVGDTWPIGTVEILKARNPSLLRMLNMVESSLDSLILIPHKSKELRKEFDKNMLEYERIINLCSEYAKRHLENKK